MTTTPTPEPIAKVDYSPNPDDWEVCPEDWMGATTPRYKHGPSGAYRGLRDSTTVRERDYVDGVLVGPPGARPGTFRSRGPEERQVIASAEAWARRDEIRPERHVVPLQRTQTVYVEVEACASTEAAWAAVQNAVLTDEQWAQGEGSVRSAFWSRDLDVDDSEHSSIAVGP